MFRQEFVDDLEERACALGLLDSEDADFFSFVEELIDAYGIKTKYGLMIQIELEDEPLDLQLAKMIKNSSNAKEMKEIADKIIHKYYG